MRYIFLARHDEVKKYVEIMQSNSFDNCVHCYDIEILNHFHPKFQLSMTKPTIKNKFKKNAKWVEKLQAILVLEYKKINVRNIFHSSTKQNASDSDIDEAFISMHQNIMTLIKVGCLSCNYKA